MLGARNREGRILSDPFMILPSRTEYPEYYTIITQPLDLQTVKRRVGHGEYKSVEAFHNDLRLIWRNATQFNERGSPIYVDADNLRRVSLKYYRIVTPEDQQVGHVETTPVSAPISRPRPTESPELPPLAHVGALYSANPAEQQLITKCISVLESLRHVKNKDKRRLCESVIRAPSQQRDPDYHAVITNSIDMSLVVNRLKSNQYGSLRQFVQDMAVMFENFAFIAHLHKSNSNDVTTLFQVISSVSYHFLLIIIYDRYSRTRSAMRSPPLSSLVWRGLRRTSPLHKASHYRYRQACWPSQRLESDYTSVPVFYQAGLSSINLWI